jgi:L-threonylcarbamoyladenylate synthase
MEKRNFDIKKIIVPILSSGGIGIFPTDTLYGLVGSALNKKAVERIYKLRKRDLKKPMIVLIPSISDLKIFGVKISSQQKKMLEKLWPGKISVVLDCSLKKIKYLHRGTKTLAFRLPKEKWLLNFLEKNGPLVAPSANIAGNKPSETCREAKKYFGDKIDFYVGKGKLKSKPSTLVRLFKDGQIKILRQGAKEIDPKL